MFFTITINKDELVEDWLFHGLTVDYLEIEDPRGHTDHPKIKFHLKQDMQALHDIKETYPAFSIVKQLIRPCHQMADLEEHKELNGLCLDMISDRYEDDAVLQAVLSSQRTYNNNVITPYYEQLRRSCLRIDKTRSFNEELSALQRIKISSSLQPGA